MDVQFPIFVFATDGSMTLIETPERILYHLEAIDIENGEYLFWDSTGAGINISIARGRVSKIVPCDRAMSLREAFESYAKSYGLQVIAKESALDTWKGFESQIPPRESLWKRLFQRSKH